MVKKSEICLGFLFVIAVAALLYCAIWLPKSDSAA